MPAWLVKVRVVKTLEKPYKIFANTAEEAQTKAAEIVLKWNGIEEAEGYDAEQTS